MTTAHLHSPETSLSAAFECAAGELRSHTVTVRELLELIGEQGLLDHAISSQHVVPALHKGADAFRRFETLIPPRALAMTGSRVANFINGGVIVIAALVLMLPLPLVPFTNTIPALAVVLLSIGMVERDGIVIVLGYRATVAAALYCGTIFWAAWTAGNGAA